MAGVLRNRLGREDQLCGPGETILQILLNFRIDHAAALGEKQGGDIVGIHQAVAGISLVEQAIAPLTAENIGNAAINIFRILAIARCVACGKVGHSDERNYADRATIGIVESSLFRLVGCQVTESPFHGNLRVFTMFLKDGIG